jgi:signal transduction histidine kinase
VRDALARTLRDPSLELALWLPDRASYADRDGRPLELPLAASGRAVTILGPQQSPVAALVHDPALLERRALLDAAGAAARLALENERLHAQLRAQVAELRASRARIVQAADAERRRLERDLHDGAQQHLLGLGIALQLLQARLGPGANGAAALLTEAETELRSALDGLRELARGIHPAILTDHGLGPALRALAERSQVPVAIDAVPEERLAQPVEAAAYFLVSESLTNVAKYARASRVQVTVVRRNGKAVIDVEDDGVGGADPSRGSGLRGLLDRVQALDGKLTVESQPDAGTHIHAEIPCAS